VNIINNEMAILDGLRKLVDEGKYEEAEKGYIEKLEQKPNDSLLKG
jgi:hypothetical protein